MLSQTFKPRLLPITVFVSVFAVVFASVFFVGQKVFSSRAETITPPVLEQPLSPPEQPVVVTEKRALIKEESVAPIVLESPVSAAPDEQSVKATPPDVALGGALNPFPLHKDIMATLFWVGEEAGKANKNISNLPSAWDEEWAKHYGGIDDPKKRDGYFPSGFEAKENPFYFALPYNDFDGKGRRKKEMAILVPWANEKKWLKNESVLKNRWIKVMKGDKTAYAQWEDVGPFKEDDGDYVFGTAEPKSKTNKHAGIDLSPAVNQILDLHDMTSVDWQFVNEKDVPDGPWKQIVTDSQVYWK
ncbi:MAG: hypothetical protein ABI747_03355 [Candidatus Moraniibacteriota bacterium]